MKLTDPNAKYAIPPAGVDDYLTPGKEYEILSKRESSFSIIDDEGRRLYCLGKGCYHINRQDWIFSSKPNIMKIIKTSIGIGTKKLIALIREKGKLKNVYL